MKSKPPGPVEPAPRPDEAELSGLGIIRVTTERFHVGPYIYASLGDAIAQAKRGRVAGNDL
jgi:hypothetical protein